HLSQLIREFRCIPAGIEMSQGFLLSLFVQLPNRLPVQPLGCQEEVIRLGWLPLPVEIAGREVQHDKHRVHNRRGWLEEIVIILRDELAQLIEERAKPDATYKRREGFPNRTGE